MATRKAAEKSVPEPEAEATIATEPIAYMGNGAAMFLADDLDICDRAEAWFLENYGGTPAVYYLLAEARFAEKGQYTTSPDVVTWKPRIFKVVKNLLGSAIIVVENDECDLAGFTESATMGLPKIPWELCQKMDMFFRHVDKKMHTEAIVILTYDPDVGGEAGWGFLVPKQTNSMASCKYEPESIVDDKPDHVIIAGSAHSHPGMSAFASHTDVGDQTNWDGLHITFGWTGGKPTEYYAELQQGGGRFTLKPEQVFVYEPEDVPFPELDDLAERVVKQGHGTKNSSFGGFGPTTGPAAGRQRSSGFGTTGPIDTPPGCPDIQDNTVVVRILAADVAKKACPVCKAAVEPWHLARRRCLNCMCFLAVDNESVHQVLLQRDSLNAPSPELESSATWSALARPIRLWERRESDSGIETEVVDVWDPPTRTPSGKA